PGRAEDRSRSARHARQGAGAGGVSPHPQPLSDRRRNGTLARLPRRVPLARDWPPRRHVGIAQYQGIHRQPLIPALGSSLPRAGDDPISRKDDLMATHRYCDGVRRRDFLKVGALGAGLSLGGYLRLAAAGQVAPNARGKAGILIYLGGGPSHMDTFDLKPDAPSEYRGEFNPIDTNVPGIQISEHLPKLAQCADKYTILRSVSHTLAAHELGRMYMNTGNRPIPSLTFPGYASVVSKELAGSPELPKVVSIPNPPHPAGYLGVAHSPLATGS